MVRIRLRRVGRKKAPVYRIVVADSRSPRDGRFIEMVGQYAPRQQEGGLVIDVERANYWLDVGAQPSDTVRSLLRRAGVLKARHESMLAKGREKMTAAVAGGPAADVPPTKGGPNRAAAVPVREEAESAE